MRHWRSDDAGFTLLEIAVALAIIMLIAGVVVTRSIGRTVDGEAAALAQNLDALGRSVVAFRNDVRRYPARLSYLSARPPSGASDTCGAPIPGRFLGYWRGPYTDRLIGGAGISSGTSTIQDSLQRAAPPGPDALLVISVEGVDQAVADRVERAFDVANDMGQGTVRWTPGVAAGRGMLTYNLPARGC